MEFKSVSYSSPLWLQCDVDSDMLLQELTTPPIIHNVSIDSIGMDTLLKTKLTDKLKSLKSQFENYQYQNIQSAHKKINQFERIGNLIFQNRAAVKLLNINADISYALSRTHFDLSDDDIFYFADLCGGMYLLCSVYSH